MYQSAASVPYQKYEVDAWYEDMCQVVRQHPGQAIPGVKRRRRHEVASPGIEMRSCLNNT